MKPQKTMISDCTSGDLLPYIVLLVWVSVGLQSAPLIVNDLAFDEPPRLSVAGASSHVALTGSGVLLSSVDGCRWRKADTGLNTFFRDVIFASGQFVAVGGSYISPPGVILTSFDGEHWIIRRCGMRTVLQSVTYGAGQFIVVGDNGTILSSRRGEEWRVERGPTHHLLTSVAYGNGTFVAVGEQGTCITSLDGRHWSRRNTGVNTFLNSVSFDNAFCARSAATTMFSATGELWTNATAFVWSDLKLAD